MRATHRLMVIFMMLTNWHLSQARGLNKRMETTMCDAHEEIYFSCPVRDKFISVCASGNFSPENGYVQYRFGRPGRPELEFPAEPEPPMSRFSITDFFGGSVNSTHLK